MPVKTYYSGNCTDDDLTWYWEQGLHDAEITGIEEVELAYDYTERNPLRTCLVIHLNTEHAYSPINTIKLYNYKIISGDIRSGQYWMCDIITKEKYLITITLSNGKKDNDIVIRFETAKTE
ncbi:MAG: hypothetical protein MJ168_08225 [Clostridia bacterium]|nr:hypothetical protein [Clostridia bacterium]